MRRLLRDVHLNACELSSTCMIVLLDNSVNVKLWASCDVEDVRYKGCLIGMAAGNCKFDWKAYMGGHIARKLIQGTTRTSFNGP